MQSKTMQKWSGITMMFVAMAGMAAAPGGASKPMKITHALQSAYGFGSGTALAFDIGGAVICEVATAGAGSLGCGIGSLL